jgi:hypothetical protein
VSFISVYPNPVNQGTVFIQLKSVGTKVTALKVYIALGETQEIDYSPVARGNNYSVDMRGFKSGVYFIQLYGDLGEVIGTEQVLVE